MCPYIICVCSSRKQGKRTSKRTAPALSWIVSDILNPNVHESPLAALATHVPGNYLSRANVHTLAQRSRKKYTSFGARVRAFVCIFSYLFTKGTTADFRSRVSNRIDAANRRRKEGGGRARTKSSCCCCCCCAGILFAHAQTNRTRRR